MNRRIRMGMVGGGGGAFIGEVHRAAARLDGLIELVAGAFSSDPQRSRRSGRSLFLPSRRVYPDFEALFEGESRLPPDERMDFVSIVTPNHLHVPIAEAALRHGFHVMCDKPLATSLEQGRRLEGPLAQSGSLFGLTYNYSGYPLIKEARRRIAEGELGEIRRIVVEYPQGWLSRPLEREGQKQASWRTDPKQAGAGGAIGDIGTHAFHLAEFVTGCRVESLLAELSRFGEGRRLDDDAAVLLRFAGGGRGQLLASQISCGEDNGLRLRVHGVTGGLDWRQEDPNTLHIFRQDLGRQIIRSGVDQDLSPEARWACRLPAGHPEGFLEAFANLYRAFALTLDDRRQGSQPAPEWDDLPGLQDGLRGLAFVESAVDSAKREEWVALSGAPASL